MQRLAKSRCKVAEFVDADAARDEDLAYDSVVVLDLAVRAVGPGGLLLDDGRRNGENDLRPGEELPDAGQDAADVLAVELGWRERAGVETEFGGDIRGRNCLALRLAIAPARLGIEVQGVPEAVVPGDDVNCWKEEHPPASRKGREGCIAPSVLILKLFALA